MICKYCIIKQSEYGYKYSCALLKGPHNHIYFLKIREAFMKRHSERKVPNNGECIWAYLNEREYCPFFEQQTTNT